MAFVLNDRVKETTTTTGTGTVNLGGAASGFDTFVAGIGNSNVTYYCIAGQTNAEFEVGIGTVTDASPDTLSRTTILSSSNSDNAVDFSAGTKDVFCTLPASKAVVEDTSGNVLFADNSKAIFGTGNDLEIYHDGSNSFINETGTGILYIQGAGTIRLRGTTTEENLIEAVENGAVSLYHNNSVKITTTSTGVDVTGVITTDGLTTSADINFGDSDKAVFGAGSDLQIYHDGTHSYVANGTNTLYLRTASSLQIENADGSEDLATFAVDGAVTLFHDNSAKLATTSTGINVTGTVTASGAVSAEDNIYLTDAGTIRGRVELNSSDRDDLDIKAVSLGSNMKFFTADSEVGRFDSSGNLLVGKTSQDSGATNGVALLPAGNSYFTNTSGNVLRLNRKTSDGNIVDFRKDNASIGSIGVNGGRLNIGSDDTHIFFDSGDSPSIRPHNGSSATDGVIDIGESGTRFKDLYLGGTANAGGLTVDGTAQITNTSSINTLTLTGNTGSVAGVKLQAEEVHGAMYGINEGTNFGGLAFHTNQNGTVAEKVRIDNSGNVGINNVSPDSKLHIQGSTATGMSADSNTLLRLDNNANNSIQINSGTSNLGQIRFGDADSNYRGAVSYNHSDNNLNFVTQGTERARIDSSGNVGIGTTSPNAPLSVVSASNANTIRMYGRSADNYSELYASSHDGGTNYAFLQGHSSQTKLATLGSTPLVLGTNGLERMRIDGSGNVGIGTTSPQGNFHVVGASGGQGEIYVSDADEGSSGSDSLLITKSGTTSFIYDRDASSQLRLGAADNSGIVVIDGSNQRVAIGATSAGAKLDVNENSSTAYSATGEPREDIIIHNTNGSDGSGVNNYASLGFQVASGATSQGFINYVRTADNLGAFTFSQRTGSSSYAEAMRIDASGNMIVGGTAIQNTFASSQDKTISIQGTRPVLELYESDTAEKGFFALNSSAVVLGGNSNTTSLQFQVDAAERMRITSSGDVGIGTTSPSATNWGSASKVLQIAGTQPLLSLKDTDTGEFQIANSGQNLYFWDTAGSGEKTRLFIKSNGDIGIGTTSPTHDVHIKRDASETELAIQSNIGGTGSAIGGRLRLQLGAQNNSGSGQADTQAGDTLGQIMFEGQGTDFSYQGGNIKTIVTTGDGSDDRSAQATAMTFETIAVGQVSPVEAMRISSEGDLYLGTTAVQGAGGLTFDHGSRGFNQTFNQSSHADNNEFITFRNAGTQIGSITSPNSSSTAYNTSSDARLKDITGKARGLEVINQLNPVAYNWKDDGKADEGLIAQEIKKVIPYVVSKNEDGFYQMDYSKLVTPLIKAVQEQQELIEDLQTQINNLGG